MESRTAKEEARRRLKKYAKDLMDLVGDEKPIVPDLLIAEKVVSIFRMASAYCPRELFECLGRDAEEDARYSLGFCRDCDNEIETDYLNELLCGDCIQEYKEKEIADI